MDTRENYIRCMRNAANAMTYLNWARRKDRPNSIRWALNDVRFWNRQAAIWRRLEKEVNAN